MAVKVYFCLIKKTLADLLAEGVPYHMRLFSNK